MPANPDTEGRLGEQDKALGGLILNVGGPWRVSCERRRGANFISASPRDKLGHEAKRCLSRGHGRTDACFELSASYIPIPPRFVAFHL